MLHALLSATTAQWDGSFAPLVADPVSFCSGSYSFGQGKPFICAGGGASGRDEQPGWRMGYEEWMGWGAQLLSAMSLLLGFDFHMPAPHQSIVSALEMHV